MLLLISILRFGNSQWCRYIYMFQAYVWSGGSNAFVPRPANYTGRWVGWHRNGQKKLEWTYKNGDADGECTLWHRDGWLEGKFDFKDGERHGTSIHWYSTGQKFEENFREGKAHGTWFVWNSNRHKVSEHNYRDGLKHGKQIRWDGKGNVEAIEDYENGKLIRTEKMQAIEKKP